MDSLLARFDRFFGDAASRDESGYLRTLAEVLKTYHPRLLYLSAADGIVAAAVELVAQVEPGLSAALALNACRELQTRPWFLAGETSGERDGQTFGLRLPGCDGTLLGGMLATPIHDDCWHPLYTSSDAEAGEVLDTFRLRQHHEQGYRVQVHDESLNAVPCGYDKESPNRHHPRFHRGAPQLVGWLACLVYNACATLLETLSPALAGKFVSTARRMFFNQKADLYCTSNALIVYMEEFPEQDLLVKYIDQFNAARHRIPWLANRQLILSLSPHAARAGP